jgi:hypothetical protein
MLPAVNPGRLAPAAARSLKLPALRVPTLFHPRLQEDGMSKPTKAAQGSAAAPAPKTFEQMTSKEKTVHVLKVVLFFVTFGFAFANILRDD